MSQIQQIKNTNTLRILTNSSHEFNQVKVVTNK